MIGPRKADTLLIGWGGTFGHLLSAYNELKDAGRDVALTHFDYILPLPKNTAEIFANYKNLVVCELNSGQFANYLRANFPQFQFKQVNKVQGQPFIVKEIVDAVNNL